METLNTTPRTLYSLSELCSLISRALDQCLEPVYWVKAEISSLSVKGGHMYLELVENQDSAAKSQSIKAKMRATCWSGTQELLSAYFESETGQTLRPGMTVLMETEVHHHPLYGLSLSVIGIDPSYTMGQLARQRQQTIAQLQADGLLDAQQLLPLPTLIRRIAVISSPSAAGYEDFKHQLDKSGYTFDTRLFGAVMQGEAAERSILAALDEISRQQTADRQSFDCVAVIRGGGATTDLSCFDSYTLCAVCAQYEIPVLTGIGHTRDISILDLVAHEALKTPTAVAEWLIHRMDTQRTRIADLLTRLQRVGERQLLIRRHRVEMLEQRLAACNPERIYRMGYSLLTKDGHVIRSVDELHPGDLVTTHLLDGSAQSIVKK